MLENGAGLIEQKLTTFENALINPDLKILRLSLRHVQG